MDTHSVKKSELFFVDNTFTGNTRNHKNINTFKTDTPFVIPQIDGATDPVITYSSPGAEKIQNKDLQRNGDTTNLHYVSCNHPDDMQGVTRNIHEDLFVTQRR